MKQKGEKRILAMIILIAVTVGSFEPMSRSQKAEAETLTRQEQQLAEEIEQAKEDTLVELKEERTENSTTYERTDGRKTTKFYGKAMRFQDPKTKEFIDYDATLQKLGNGTDSHKRSEQKSKRNGYRYENKAGDKKNYLPQTLSEDTPLLTEYKDCQMSLTPFGAQVVSESAAGLPQEVTKSVFEWDQNEVHGESSYTTKVERENVEDLYGNEENAITGVSYTSEEGVCYQYKSQTDGIKGSILLDSVPDNSQFSFTMQLKNCYAKIGGEDSEKKNADNEKTDSVEGKAIGIYNEKGDQVGIIPVVFCNDDTNKAYNEECFFILNPIREEKKGKDILRTYRLALQVGDEYLHSKDRVYPVRIDLSMTWEGAGGYTNYDTYVRDGETYQNKSYRSNDIMPVGQYGGNQFRSYLKFEDIETTLLGKYIENAELQLTESAGSEKGVTVQGKRVASSGDSDTINSANRLTWDKAVLATLASVGIENTVQSVKLTDYVVGLLQKNYPNQGLVLMSDKEEADTNDAKAAWFHTDNASAEYRPSLLVTYYDAPATPNVSLSKTYIKKGENVTLTWSEATARSLSHVEYRIAKYNDSTASEIEEVVPYSAATGIGTGEYGNATIPTSSLTEGCYKIVVRGVDSQGNTGTGRGVVLHVDGTMPALEDASLSPGTTKVTPRNEAPELSWSGAVDAHFERVEYCVNNGDYVSEGNYTLADTTESGSAILAAGVLSSEGVNTIRVRAVDQSGNISEEESFRYYYDNVAPDIKSIILNDNSETNYAHKAATVTYDVKDAYLKEVSVRVNGGPYLHMGSTGKGSYQVPDSLFSLTNVYTIEIQATDKAGNVSNQALPYYYSDLRGSIQNALQANPASVVGRLAASYYASDFQEYIEGYKPVKLICTERWDGLTELSWGNTLSNLPYEVSYEVHRSTSKGFTPSPSTVIKYVKQNNSVIDNNLPEETYYYKVCAVLRDYQGKITNTSSYSKEVSGTTVPSGETGKRLGEKSHLPYVNFSTGSANGRIEQTGGNLFLQMPSISIPSKELTTTIDLVYNSVSNVDYGMGPGWMLPYQMRLKATDTGLLYQDETGAKYELTMENGEYRTAENPNISITTCLCMWDLTGRYTYKLEGKDNVTCHFDDRGRINQVTNTNGDYQTFIYDDYHENLKMIITSTNKSAAFYYDEKALANGEVRLEQVSFPDGSYFLYQYNSEKQLSSVILKKDEKSIDIGKFEYRSKKMTKLLDGKGNAYGIGYTDGKASQIIRPNRDVIMVEYNGGARQTTVHTENGGVRQCSESVTYDEWGRIRSKKDAAGLKTEYQYGTKPNQKYSITEETKEVVEQVVNPAGIVTTVIKQVVNTTAYDDNVNVTNEMDEQGNTTEYQYNNDKENTKDLPSRILEEEKGKEEGEEDEDDEDEGSEPIEYGEGETVFDASVEYDDDGNEIVKSEKISQTVTTSNTTSQFENGKAIGHEVDEKTSELGLPSSQETSEYDASGNLITESGQSGTMETKVQTEYDIMGRVKKIEEFLITINADQSRTEKLNCTTGFDYDEWGRQTKTTIKWENIPNAKDEVESIQYDNNGNVIEKIDKEGVKTETKYDNMNRVLSTVTTKNNLSQQTTYEYSYDNITVYDGKGGSHVYAGVLKTVTKNHVGGVIDTSYRNGLGQVVRSISGGIYTDSTYDAMGRVIVTYVMGTSPRTTGGKVTCQLYDTAGNVTKTLVNPGKYAAAEEPGLYEIDLSQYSRLYNSGTAVFDENGLRAANTDCAGFLIPLPKAIKGKERVEIRVSGVHTGEKGIRVFLSNDGNGPGNQVESIDVTANSLPAVWTVTAEKNIEKIVIKSVAGKNLEPSMLIKSVVVKYLDDKTVPTVTPTKVPTPKPTMTETSSFKPDYDTPAGFQALDLSAFTADLNTDGSSITRYDEKGMYAKNANLYLKLVEETNEFPQGKEVEVIMVGKKLGNSQFRTMLHKGSRGASDIFTYADNASGVTQKEYGFEWKCKFTTGGKAPGNPSDASTANLLALKGPAGGKMDEIQIYHIFVKWDGMEMEAAPTEIPKALTVDLTNTANYNKVGGTASAAWDAAENAVKVKTGGYGQGIVFKFTLPPWETLEDYGRLQYDVKFISDNPVSWKRIRADVATGLAYSGITGTASDATFGAGAMYHESGVEGRDWYTDQVIDTRDLFRHEDKTGEVYLAIGLHAGGSPDNGGDAYLVKNVRLIRSGKPKFMVTGNTLTTSTEYDTLGNVVSQTDEMGVITAYQYDAQKRVTEVCVDQNLRWCGQRRTYQYDDTKTSKGNITTWTDGDGGRSSETKNAAGQVLEIADYDGSKKYATAFEYDTTGNLIKQTQPNGDYIVYEYDGKNQQKEKQCYRSKGVLTSATKYEYNMAGNLTKMTDYTVDENKWIPLRTEVTGYDVLQRITSYSVVDGTDRPTEAQLERAGILYYYDMENRLTRVTYVSKQKGLKSMSFEYNGTGWLMKVKGTVSGVGEQTLREYQYNKFGSVETTTDSLEYLTGGDRKLVKNYQYDNLERVVKMVYGDSKRPDNINLQESFTYEYDKKSRIKLEQHNNFLSNDEKEHFLKTTRYNYNNQSRLTNTIEEYKKGSKEMKTKQTAYSYDRAGNRIHQNENGVGTDYEYNGLNQLTKSMDDTGTWTYSYDANGNQTQVSHSTNLVTKNYRYDVENRLTWADEWISRIQTKMQENAYNGYGQRIHKKMFAYDSNYQEEDICYFYEDSSVLYTTSGNNTGMNAADIVYLYGASEHVMLAEEKNSAGQPVAYGYTKDIRGSSCDLIDSSGQIMVRYDYDDFGETSISGTGAMRNELMYTGEVYDKDTGQYYLNARYYDPADGRFISQDSYRGEQTNPDTWNLYAYCAGNPINYTDPTGHSVKSIIREELREMTTLKGNLIENFLKRTLKNRNEWCNQRSAATLKNASTSNLLARMLYGECTPETKDPIGDRYEMLAFWQVVKNSCSNTKSATVKNELLKPGRYYGLRSKVGLNPSKDLNWARSVIVGTMFQNSKLKKLKSAPGIGKDVKHWHMLSDWVEFSNKAGTKVYFKNKGKKDWYHVKGYLKFSGSIFYSRGKFIKTTK